MASQYNPNRRPFARGFVIEPFEEKAKLHPLHRQAAKPYFESQNKDGFWHDLGAQDVFLDNFGLLLQEQFYPDLPIWEKYERAIRVLLGRWQMLRWQVLQGKPYWGKHFNAVHRKANAGEPRSLIRLMSDEDWSRVPPDQLQEWDPGRFGTDWSWHRGLDLWQPTSFMDGAQDVGWPGRRLIGDWESLGEVPEAALPDGISPGGVPLPDDYPTEVDRLPILDPRHSTPDLPQRVGGEKRDVQEYERVLRDQGSLGTCAAHAVAGALDILVMRQHKGHHPRFSPAWLHCKSGNTGSKGRSVGSVIDVIRQALPCEEPQFRYDINYLGDLNPGSPPWETSEMKGASQSLTERYSTPFIRKVDPKDIATLKTLLAAGSVIIAATSLTDEMLGPGFKRYGLAVTPLRGQRRMKEGHAWLIVGYDHVDGSKDWKYQGHFLALNSWGKTFP